MRSQAVRAPRAVPRAPAGTNHSIWRRLSHDRTRGTGARVEKRDAQRVRTYQPPLVIVLAPLKRRLESHVRRHRARWGWRGAARCELRLKRGGKRAPRGQHERDRKQAQHLGGASARLRARLRRRRALESHGAPPRRPGQPAGAGAPRPGRSPEIFGLLRAIRPPGPTGRPRGVRTPDDTLYL